MTREFANRTVLAFIFTILIGASAGVNAQQALTTASGRITEFDVNGMKVLVKQRPGTPTISTGLFFRGGVRNTDAKNAGIERLTLSVAGEGSKNFPQAKLRKELTRHGSLIASGSNYDFSVLSLASTKQGFDASWKVFVDVAINPTFTPADVQRVREATLTALRGTTDSPEGAIETLSNRIVFAGHPYMNPPEGTVETVSRLTAADLTVYHKKIMETSRLLLVIVGDVDPAALRGQLNDSFGKLPRGNFQDTPPSPLKFDRPVVDVFPKTVQTTYLQGTFAAPSLRDPDYYAMRTAMTILQTQVFQEVRVRRNLSYAPEAELHTFSANTASIAVTSSNPNEAIKVMLEEMRKLREYNIDEDTIGQMSGYFLTTHFLKQETNAAQAAELAQYELIGGGWRRSLDFLEKMRQVKPADVRSAANKYMSNIKFAVVGDEASIDRSVFVPNKEAQ